MNDIAWLLPFLFQAGAQPVSQPPAPDKSLPMMSTRYAQPISVSGLPGEMMPLSGKQFGLVWADGPRRNPHTRHCSGGTGHPGRGSRSRRRQTSETGSALWTRDDALKLERVITPERGEHHTRLGARALKVTCVRRLVRTFWGAGRERLIFSCSEYGDV